MRHNVKGRKLGRTASHRKATLNSLITSLLKYKRIKTTLAKAKETRVFAEKMITRARKGDLNAKKNVMKVIKDKEVVKELFAEIIQKIGDRPGGYTRVVKLGHRMGDAAQMGILELVDYNEVVTARAEEQKEKREAKAKVKAEKAKAEKDDKLLEQQASEAPVK
jgi:large subunit ribosomal protein L17